MKDPQQANSNFGEILSKWLSFKGRINQQDFWLFHVLPFVLLYLLPIPFISLFSIWVLLAGTVKRLHDSNSSGKALIPFGILWVVLVVIVIVILFFSFLGGMTGNVSANEFEDQLMILGLPILVLLLLPIYAGLKPSSPDENKYGSPPPPLVIGIWYKIALTIGIIISIVSLGYRDMLLSEDKTPDDPLMIQVIKSGNIGRLRILFENGEDPNQTSGQGSTALMITLRHHPVSYEAAKLLLEYGANPNINSKFEDSKYYDEHTPLVVAAGQRTLRPFGLLEPTTEEGANPDPPNANYIELVELMLEKGANPNPTKAHSDEETPLMAAIQEARSRDEAVTVVELLLTHGADPNPPRVRGNEKSPLDLAISFSHKSRSISGVVKALLTHGADLSLAENKRVLLNAVSQGRVEVVNLLLDHGAELNTPINDSILQIAIGWDALIMNPIQKEPFEMTRCLLAQKISLKEIAKAKQWVENKLSNHKAPNELDTRNRLLEIQRLLTEAENNSGR
ncbi:MAG: ankyrin repeat domain-containing protein [Maribacter arcticus]|uniref:ankyrin repeat domain-containing protein n=1 Tax=Maribacter arcticus TaxID=561365 RepID=UPI003001471C